MVKKVFTISFICLMVAFTIVIVTNKNIANEIFIFIEDSYDKLIGNSIEDFNPEDIKINKLQVKKSTFYYNTLTDDQKKIYASISNAVKNIKNKAKVMDYNYIDDSTTMNDTKIAIQNFFLDHPEVFYVKNEYTVSTIDLLNSKRIEVELNYNIENEIELNSQINNINDVLDQIISNTKNMNEFDKELYIHDQICGMSTYYKYNNINDVPEECHSIYGCLISKKAVCDGLSKAFMLALNKAGIESIIVTGNLQNQAHAWNMVKLDDEWYHVDITSNKSVKSYGSEKIIHSYFNITDTQIKTTNSIDMEGKLPIANSTKYNYYIQTDKFIKSSENFSTKFSKILDENEHKELIEFAVDKNVRSVPDKMVNTFQDYKYKKYVNYNDNKFNYYNVLNTYILLTNN